MSAHEKVAPSNITGSDPAHLRFIAGVGAASNGPGGLFALPAPHPAELLFDPAEVRFGRFLDSDPPDREMMVADWLPADIVGLLAAMGGVGKSVLFYMLAISVASGARFLGLDVHQVGGVLALFGEDDEHELHRRGRRILDHLQRERYVDTRGLAERLHVVSRVADNNLLTVGREGEVARTQLVDRLIATARLIPDLKLILIDPVSRFRGGRANNEEDATLFVTALEQVRAETGATVLASVHVNKASTREGEEADQAAVRGSSALVDGVRWCAQMQRLRRDAADSYGVSPDQARNFVRLDLVKTNYTAPWPGMWLHREAGGVLVPTDLERQEDARKEARTDARYTEVLDRLRELLTREGPLTRTRVEQQYAGSAGLLGAGEKTVRSIIARAVDAGDLLERDDPAGRGGRLLSVGGGA